ncbi:hypothetical protein [Ralstonia pseudosolanacearum]|uniref:hypothetical protein n=1 Tax=Ralstonia pseudosolanacearum TaxID=1310165 RepID=UPI003CED6CAC
MWITRFEGTVEDRPVKVSEYNDGEGERGLRVETNYGKDQILGESVRGVIAGVPVSADDTMHVEATTPEELESALIEEGFTPAGAKEIARHVILP